MTNELLPASFFRQEALDLARALLGRWLRHGEIILAITEVEAYRGPTDSGCHTFRGRTPRTAPMWGPPGHLYVYTCYGIHQMLNIVAGPHDGAAAAVLVRACAPVVGPGRVGRALGIDRTFNHHPLYEPGGVELLHGEPVHAVASGRRIGIDYALPEHRDAPWRLAVAGSPWVSHRRGLRPEVEQSR
jgi:DNA-3-methyladenine glycosylase